MYSCFFFAPGGRKPARYLLLIPRRPRKFSQSFLLASIIG
jgi:hypothetical protein